MSPTFRFISWCSWRLGGLSILALLCLCFWVIADASIIHHDSSWGQRHDAHETSYLSIIGSTMVYVLATFFALYTLLNHILVIIFTLRTNWSIWEMTELVREYGGYCTPSPSTPSMSSSIDGRVFDVEDLEVETLPLVRVDVCNNSVLHAIIIPNYTEDIETLRETLEVLASHHQAQSCYDICLAMEVREGDSESKALCLLQEYDKSFRSMGYTLHPSNMPGEAAGKGSNVAWAARQISSNYSRTERSNVVVTIMDSDSHLSYRYFAHITNMQSYYPKTASTTMYTGPIVFDRNAHKVPTPVRMADVFWSASTMSGLCKASSISPPTSVYSLPLFLVDLVGGWDTSIEALGEDLHMFLKCFFALNGHLTSRTVPTPISQTNITGGNEGGISGFWSGTKARYRQSLRHMWGALDTGFVLRKLIEMWQNREQTSKSFYPLHQGQEPSCYFSKSSLHYESSQEDCNGNSDVYEVFMQKPQWGRVLRLAHRLFEAHYLSVHTTILILAMLIYKQVTGDEDPLELVWLFKIIYYMGNAIAIIGIPLYLLQYWRFHNICVGIRKYDMARAGILDGMDFSRRRWFHMLDHLWTIVTAPTFGAVPCAQAEMMHFWTLDIVHAVSRKPTRQREELLPPRNAA